MGEVKVQSHNVSLTSYRLTSLSSMSIGHPIAELRLFQNLTLKFEGQGHGWGHSSKSQCGCNILSTHIPFVPCQSALPFLRYSIFKIWPWKSMVKVMGRAGASTRFTSTSTCNMCEYEYESEYLIITWVRVRVQVLVDEYEYKCEYRSVINILYSMYRQQIFIVRSLTRESSNCYKPVTKLQLPIVHVNYLCQYIYISV